MQINLKEVDLGHDKLVSWKVGLSFLLIFLHFYHLVFYRLFLHFYHVAFLISSFGHFYHLAFLLFFTFLSSFLIRFFGHFYHLASTNCAFFPDWPCLFYHIIAPITTDIEQSLIAIDIFFVWQIRISFFLYEVSVFSGTCKKSPLVRIVTSSCVWIFWPRPTSSLLRNLVWNSD